MELTASEQQMEGRLVSKFCYFQGLSAHRWQQCSARDSAVSRIQTQAGSVHVFKCIDKEGAVTVRASYAAFIKGMPHQGTVPVTRALFRFGTELLQ